MRRAMTFAGALLVILATTLASHAGPGTVLGEISFTMRAPLAKVPGNGETSVHGTWNFAALGGPHWHVILQAER